MMSKIKLALWAQVFILLVGLFVGPAWVGIICLIALCFALPAAIYGMILLRSDPKNRDWDVEIQRNPNGIYRWEWWLLADGKMVETIKGLHYTYTSTVSGSADTKIGCLLAAADKRREILSSEKAHHKKEQGSSTFSLSGRRQASTKGPATETQQKSSGLLARYFQAIERLIHRS